MYPGLLFTLTNNLYYLLTSKKACKVIDFAGFFADVLIGYKQELKKLKIKTKLFYIIDA